MPERGLLGGVSTITLKFPYLDATIPLVHILSSVGLVVAIRRTFMPPVGFFTGGSFSHSQLLL
jgi:hypothetical protein